MALCFMSRAALAATYYVPDNFATIQEALDGASGGDTIIVRNGTYTGPGNRDLTFGGKALTLRSENGAANCIIDCESGGRGFNFNDGETAASVVDGFTIVNGAAGSGGGIRCYAASPTIRNCVIRDCTAGNAAGVYCYDSSVVITGCTITGNTATGSLFENGGGIWFSQSSPTMSDCTISLNTAGADGGGIWLAGSSLSISGCTIILNTAGRDGGGLYAISSSPTATDSSVVSNFAGRNGGGVYTETSTPTLTDCLINSNWATHSGGGMDSLNCPTVTITNCLFTGNLATFGGAIDSFGSSPTIANCTLSGNTATEGGAINSYSSASILTDCILYYNTAATGAELMLSGASTLTVTYANVQGGQAAAQVAVGSTLVWGPAGMDHDPMFATGAGGDYYLSQAAAGQAMTSMCVDAGSDTASALGLDTYTTRTDSVADSAAVDVGYHYPDALPGPLTSLNCVSPGNESILYSAPTFAWTTDGGSNNRYVVDLSFSVGGPWYSTPVLQDKSWTMPSAIWSRIPSGSYIYWRVRGADLDDTPLTILYSAELWWFYKP